MFVYLSNKIAIRNTRIIRYVSWNKDQGYIACGCDGGLLKILRLESRKVGVKSAGGSKLSTYQTLEGHSGPVNLVKWNEICQKLMSIDQNGLIMVWMVHQSIWYGEMVNNHNKSVITGMAWNPDGQKMCIVYEDGAIIVGSVDGNKIWGKELKGTHLSQVEWSPDGKLLLFGLQNGDVHVYEAGGTFKAKLPLPCMESVKIPVRLVGIRWCKKSKWEPDRPSLVLAYESGHMQFMRNENDKFAVVIDAGIDVSSFDWNHEGSILAVTGKFSVTKLEKKNIVVFYDPYGLQMQVLPVPGQDISGCSWEGGGLRIALAVDNFIFFANIRLDYKWCFFSETLVYVFNRNDPIKNSVMFWNVNTGKKHVKIVRNLVNVIAFGDFCVIISKSGDSSGEFSIVLSNAIGSLIDSWHIDLEPCAVTMNSSYVYVASNEVLYSWHFHTSQNTAILELGATEKSRFMQERIFYVGEIGISPSDTQDKHKLGQHKPIRGQICCITASEKILIIARSSGTFQRYLIPETVPTHRYDFDCYPSKITLNSASTRMSIVDCFGILTLYDLDAESVDASGQVTVGKKLKFERKDVWNVKWAADDSEMFVLMEKTGMYIFRNLDPVEPVSHTGYMCSFKDLEVKTVLLGELMQNPEDPKEKFVIQSELKSLRETRDLIENVGIKEASKFIEDNSHIKLWQLLAEAAVRKMDFEMAELAFVRCKDYPGIQFVKKLAELKSEFMRKAEIAMYFKKFDEAEKLYIDNERVDLAIDLRRVLGDWFRVAQLLKTGGADDIQVQEAWNAIGDYYADMQKWENAITYYVQGHNQGRIAHCYYMLEDYAGLESLVNSLPESHKLLLDIGSMFTSIGMCEQAVLAYLKCHKVKLAIDSCVRLSQWNMAIMLAQKHNLKGIDELFAQYAKKLIDENKILSAVGLYRKAHKFLDAARLALKFSKEEGLKRPDQLYMKKLYVMVGMLVEDYRSCEEIRSKSSDSLTEYSTLKSPPWKENSALPFGEDSELLYEPWKGAEAYHFLLLAQKQLYDGHIDAAMKTSLLLQDYEDILNTEEIYCLLALTSCANRAFATCSRAFMKLDALEKITEQQRLDYEDLSYEIFLKHSPKDADSSEMECPSCSMVITDYSAMCPSCDTKFPICVASGRPIMDKTQQFLCTRCQHFSHQQHMLNRMSCALCHQPISSL